MRKVVSIIGSSVVDAKVAKIAYDVGSAIAKRGYILACGGLGGVMEAACKGAKNANGTTMGILPGIDKSDANTFVDIAIPTGIGLARNLVVVLVADAIVVISGGAGTLSEIGYAWQTGKPIIALIPSGGWAEKFAGTALDDRRAGKIDAAHSVEELVQILGKYLE